AVSSTLEQVVESTILNREFTKAFAELIQALADKLQDEWDKRAKIEIDHENYGLEYDEATDSYSWKKADELGNTAEEELTSNQIQNITSNLINSETYNSEHSTDINPENPALTITISLKERGEIVLYEQLDNGTVNTNVVEEIGFEEVIEVAAEPLNKILTEEQFSIIADELLSQVEADITLEDIANDLLAQLESQLDENFTPNIDSEASKLLSQVEIQIESENVASELLNQVETQIENDDLVFELLNQVESQIEIEEVASNLLTQVESQLELEQPDFIVNSEGKVSNNKPGKIVKREASELVFFEEEENSLARIKTAKSEVSAANVSYQEAVSSPELSESQKSWVREKQVPVYADTIPRQYAIKQENKEMAIAAKELVRKYGEIQEEGSVSYKSDAFTIKKVGNEYSIHHRKDELSGYANPAMSFSLDKKGCPINIKADKLNGAERSCFLLVADDIRDGLALPDKNTDIREIENQLGSLAPAGTQKLITSFQNAEVMKIMADSLLSSKTDELKIGDFLIKGEQNADLTRASLKLYKIESDGSERLAVNWEATKRENGILETEMKTMNLGENEINQLKFVAANANYLNNNQYSETIEAKAPTAWEIPLPLHPILKRELNKIESVPENEELRSKLNIQGGKLSVAEQREVYSLISLQHQNQLDSTGQSNINLPPLKQIIQDLSQQRKDIIYQTYKPNDKTNNTQKTASKKLNVVRKKDLEL
ncbi:MAG: hypothetical protein AAF349_24635, partial [Cyanobacteria bacterium P01_A01_bin.68]